MCRPFGRGMPRPYDCVRSGAILIANPYQKSLNLISTPMGGTPVPPICDLARDVFAGYQSDKTFANCYMLPCIHKWSGRHAEGEAAQPI